MNMIADVTEEIKEWNVNAARFPTTIMHTVNFNRDQMEKRDFCFLSIVIILLHNFFSILILFLY